MPKVQLDSQIWRDEYYQSLSVDESRIFIYLITCPASNIYGIYQISFDEIVAHNKKIPEKKIKEILNKFENDLKILYKNGYICIKNRTNYNVQDNESITVGFNKCVENTPIFIKEFLLKHDIINTVPPPSPHGTSNDIVLDKIELSKDSINNYMQEWNNSAWRTKIKSMNEHRIKQLKTRLANKEFDFTEILKQSDLSGDFLKTGKWFTFDWIVKNDTNWRKVIEGNYINKKQAEEKEVWKTNV